MKTILVPTDFSECAEHALYYACHIAEKTNAKIILLHVLEQEKIETSFYESEWMGQGWAGERSDVAVPAMMRLMKEVKKKMSAWMDFPQCRNISMIDRIEIGRVNRMIIRAAGKHKADMIVMGTHGTSGWNEIFIGSNAEHIVRDAEIPVLAVKENHTAPQIKNIVFATDFSNETDLVFSSIKNFAEIFDAKIQIVKIMSAPTLRGKQEMDKLFENILGEAHNEKISTHTYYHNQKEIGIRNFAQTVNADLIALGTHGRHGLARFFKGSIAENLVNHAPLPVLTINFHKKQLEGRQPLRKVSAEDQIAESMIPETYFSGHVPSI